MLYNITETKEVVKQYMDPARFDHTVGVMDTAACLAMCHGADMEKALIAGLLHDCAKCMPESKMIQICQSNQIPISQVEAENSFLLHGKVGAYLAKTKYGIHDEEILHSIVWHTTGKPAMTQLEKIIYIADYIEPMRKKASNLAIVRKLAFEDLDQALFKILSDTLVYLKDTSKNLDPMTVQAYEYYKERLQKENF